MVNKCITMFDNIASTLPKIIINYPIWGIFCTILTFFLLHVLLCFTFGAFTNQFIYHERKKSDALLKGITYPQAHSGAGRGQKVPRASDEKPNGVLHTK